MSETSHLGASRIFGAPWAATVTLQGYENISPFKGGTFEDDFPLVGYVI